MERWDVIEWKFGWMYRLKNEYFNGCVGWIDGMDERIVGWIGWMNGRVDGMCEWMDGWMVRKGGFVDGMLG